jgi:predicted nucleic acid-binding protein
VAREFFVDASAWLPLAIRTHADHARLAEALRTLLARGRRPVTTNLVVAEAHALLLRRTRPPFALQFLEGVGGAPNVIVYSNAELETAAKRDWLGRYAEQRFSLADAVSFALMKQRGIEDALTLDHHFATAGFRVIP